MIRLLKAMIFALLVVIVFYYMFIEPVDTPPQTEPIPGTLPLRPNTRPFPGIQNIEFEDIEFPKEFFFGSASSDFQTTGGNGLTDWNEFVESNSGKTNEAGTPWVGPDNGTDFLNRYKEDFDLAGQIGIQVHRISLEWARIEPEEGKFDQKAIDKYKEIFRYMRSRGIEPMICMNHFALPKWFTKIDGWENPKAAYYYSRYAEFLAKEVGLPLKIRWWLTFNEPQFVISIPYGKGSWPPFKGIRNYTDEYGTRRFALVTSHVFDAHRLSYRAIHKVMDPELKAMVGFASAPGSFSPDNPSSRSDLMAYNAYNLIYSLSLDYFMGAVDRDFIGLNYYGHTPLKFHFTPTKYLTQGTPFDIEWVKPDTGQRPKYIKPSALYDLIMQFKDLGLPIVITESGISDDTDNFREEFIVTHLKAIHDSIKDGAPVVGFQYWTLADTWEWDGFFSQMGLIEIDRKDNLKRIARPSALAYSEIIRTKKIRKGSLEKYKELLQK